MKDQSLKDKILNIDVLILLPSMNLVDTVYKDIRILRKLLEDFKKKNLVVGIKYHPKDKDGNAVLDAGNQFTIVPTYLPAEIVFSLINDDAIIIGDVSSALFSAKWLLPKSKTYQFDTNLNGEERSFVVSGQYEKVFPFDIYPVQLIKSIITNDIEKMENLGIYEVSPEDFALCEFVCTSKINIQEIVRNGLDLIYKECM